MNEAWKIFFEMYFSNGADIFVFVIAPMLWVSSMFIARRHIKCWQISKTTCFIVMYGHVFINLLVLLLQVDSFHQVGPIAESLLQGLVCDVWTGHQLSIESHAVVLYLVDTHWERRGELAQQAVYGMRWDFPDTEEAQDMVDAISGKVFCHLAETLLPPQIIVLFHHVPIVSWEAPVLSVG